MLILSSYGFGSTCMRQKIGDTVKDMNGRMLIIPFASWFGVETGKKEKTGAVLQGFGKERIDIFDEASPDRYLNSSYDYICVSGGNTFRLLSRIKKYHLDTFIKEQVANGAVYMGFSAGAYLACPDIEYVKLLEDNNDISNGDFSALALTDKYVLCHNDYRGTPYIIKIREFIGKPIELITLNNDQMVVL